MTKRPSPESPAGSKRRPCDACRTAKVKCNHEEPCENCTQKDRECVYSMDESGRLRKFHKRSKLGCTRCKTRRVRCDEIKPVCGGCSRTGAAAQCLYPNNDVHDSSPAPPIGLTPHGIAPPSPAVDFDVESFLNALSNPANLTTGPGFENPASQIDSTAAPLGIRGQPDDMFTLASGTFADSAATSAWHNFDPSAIHNPNLDLLDDSASHETTRTFGLVPALAQVQAETVRPDLNSTSTASRTDSPIISLPNTPPSTMCSYGNGLREDRTFGSTFLPFSSGQDLATFPGTHAVQPYRPSRAPIHQPDALLAYFPSSEQRQQYKHFYTETVQSLIVLPTPPSSNPWLTHLSALALGAAHGQDLAHDALRCSILSLSSFDIGYKIHHSLSNRMENVMYTTSTEQRTTCLQLLSLAKESGDWTRQPEVVLGSCLALSFRDRLAGSAEWETPLKIAAEIIAAGGGPGLFIAQNPTPTRRYLVEEMVCVEILALFATFDEPAILSQDTAWLDQALNFDPNDHLHVVFGWDRSSVKVAVQMCIIANEYRKAEVMRERNKSHGYQSIRDLTVIRLAGVKQQCLDLLALSAQVRSQLSMMPLPSHVSLCSTAFQLCIELFVQLIVLGSEKLAVSEGQAKVEALLEVTDDAMSRGMYAGLLLSLTWAAACAAGKKNVDRANRLLGLLRGKYHLEHVLLDRIIGFDWKLFDGVAFEDWEKFLRDKDLYVPIY